MKDRWIKLYASTLTDAVFTDTDSDTLKVWIWILLSVFYKPNTVFVGNKQVELLPGQMIFGRKAAGIKLGIHPSKVYRIVQKLAKKGCISIKTTKKYKAKPKVKNCLWKLALSILSLYTPSTKASISVNILSKVS